MTWNIDPIISKIRKTIDTHKLPEPGAYTRWLWLDDYARSYHLNVGRNEYGCADAANIQYTIGCFPQDPAERAAALKVLQDFQDPETGMFREATHHPIHTTAHCTGAIELFDAVPRYPLTELSQYLDTAKLAEFMENLDWFGNPWCASHQGAGVYAALYNARMTTLEWRDFYFRWLNDHVDPETGYSIIGGVKSAIQPEYHHLNGWFHYLFNYVNGREAFPMPEKLVDACIDLYRNKKLGETFCVWTGFAELDWIFTINRASRQTPHRFHESRELIRDFADRYFDYFFALDEQTDNGFNDMHCLFGMASCLAEIQLALPGEVKTTVPLKSVLDRRPFV